LRYFFDSSALAKLFLREQGSENATQLVESTAQSDLVCSALAALEIRSAIQRKALFHEISPALSVQALRFLEEEMERWIVIPINQPVLALAAQAIDQHFLRALDAVQLGTALSMPDRRDSITFVTADTRLLAVAQTSGFRTFNPQH
jgi:predicted nucleic acid-binding protein